MTRSRIVALVVLVSAHAVSAANLSGDQITSLVSGKSAHWRSADGKNDGTSSWSTDGIQRITGKFKGASSDEGPWYVKGDKLCNKLKFIRKGKENCSTVNKISDGKYELNNGNVFTID